MSKQSAIKQERLMVKAEELFLKYGYKAVSMDQIARESGVSKMTIYKRYPSKDDLFIAVLINMTKYHEALLEQGLLERPHTVDKIEYLYSYSMNNLSVIPDLLIKEIMERAYVMEAVTQYKMNMGLELWKRIIRDGMAKGEIRNLDVDFTAKLLLSMPNAVFSAEDYTDTERLNVFLTNFYDFVKYGLLGGDHPCPKTS